MNSGMESGQYFFRPPAGTAVPVVDSKVLFPVNRVYCVGQNYAEHAAEMGASPRQAPFFFSKPADAIVVSESVPYPPMTGDLHHEVELVVALREGGRNVNPDRALDLVFGYGIGVDLTRRDLQAEAKNLGRPWTTAKGFDHSAPLSAIRRVSGIGHPDHSAISLSVNGQERQRGNTSDMIWTVPEIIAELSRYFELAPGDLIFTGTPAGVGALNRGDRVECSIREVGSMGFEIS